MHRKEAHMTTDRDHPRLPRGKRVFDVLAACVLLGVLSPLLAAIALTIRCTAGSPVIFRQQRPGLRGEIFTMYKFRTMRQPEPGENPWTTDDLRLTRVGRVLQRTSLRSEEHTSELQSHVISYAVFCLKKK